MPLGWAPGPSISPFDGDMARAASKGARLALRRSPSPEGEPPYERPQQHQSRDCTEYDNRGADRHARPCRTTHQGSSVVRTKDIDKGFYFARLQRWLVPPGSSLDRADGSLPWISKSRRKNRH